MENTSISALKAVPVLASIPPEHIEWLLENGESRTLETGERLFAKGEPAEHMYIILSGQINISIDQNGQHKHILTLRQGDVTGLLPYSRLKTAGGWGVAAGPTEILTLHKSKFPELERTSPELVQELVALMTDRVRDFTRTQQQNEKLMALGKLSAGLAHELNNPAAAIVRSSDELHRIHHNVPEKFKRVIMMRLNPEQVDEVNAILFEKINGGMQSGLSMLERNSLEDEMNDWLEERGVSDPYEISTVFVESGISMDELDAIGKILGGKHVQEVLEWIANTLNTERIICDIKASSRKISDLVNAVKTYSHMDRSQDKEKTVLHEGIRSTLTMLGHKLREKNIRVSEDFPQDLPQVSAYVSELNQVWTNLIDNAIDAMSENGELSISARHEGNFVRVEIADNGSGIPADIITRIFEPFFTTKPVGRGSGLGLDIAMKIMQHHNADIKVASEPGRTVFTLCFPLE